MHATTAAQPATIAPDDATATDDDPYTDAGRLWLRAAVWWLVASKCHHAALAAVETPPRLGCPDAAAVRRDVAAMLRWRREQIAARRAEQRAWAVYQASRVTSIGGGEDDS